MDNYQYCANWVSSQAPTPDQTVLDFGCGTGRIVEALRAENIQSFGCDVFYEGGSYESMVKPELLGSIIKKMTGSRIPYEDESFDFVLSNQVLEHVENLEDVIAEFHRVLKPGGQVLSLFPDRSVWREGHCGIPFLHRFPKGSQPRVYYTLALRTMGLGYNKEGKSRREWSEFQCEWLDNWTHYRSLDEIHETFDRYFEHTANISDDFLVKRAAPRWLTRTTAGLMVPPLQRYIVRKLAGLVLVSKKAR